MEECTFKPAILKKLPRSLKKKLATRESSPVLSEATVKDVRVPGNFQVVEVPELTTP